MSLSIERDHDETMTVSTATTPFSKALWRALLGAVAVIALAGCHHAIPKAFKAKDCNRPQPFDRAQSIPPLRVPPGIDPPDTHSSLRIPAYNEPAPPPRPLTGPCLDEPPLYATPNTTTPSPAPGTGGTNRVPST